MTTKAAAPQVYAAINQVTTALAKVGLGKSQKNQQQGWAFRGIDDLYNVLAPLLGEAGLCILPRVLNREITERPSARGGLLFYVTVEVEYDLVSAVDGSSHTIKAFGEAMDSGDKATNKAMSAAFKYALFETFCIPTEGTPEEKDADVTTHEVRSPDFITVEQIAQLRAALKKAKLNEGEFCKVGNIASLDGMPATMFAEALAYAQGGAQ